MSMSKQQNSKKRKKDQSNPTTNQPTNPITIPTTKYTYPAKSVQKSFSSKTGFKLGSSLILMRYRCPGVMFNCRMYIVWRLGLYSDVNLDVEGPEEVIDSSRSWER